MESMASVLVGEIPTRPPFAGKVEVVRRLVANEKTAGSTPATRSMRVWPRGKGIRLQPGDPRFESELALQGPLA